jgi:hypothetical protein
MASKNIRELKNIITQMDALLPTLSDKPTKAADVLIEKASAIKALISLEAEERETEQDVRIKELDAQHEADARRIAELERANAALCDRPLPEAIKVPDPEHASVRQENARLNDLIKTIAWSFKTEHEKAMQAIRIIQSCSREQAEFFVPLLGVDFRQYFQMLSTYRTQQQLEQAISAAQHEGPVTVFARAALALRGIEPEVGQSGDSRSSFVQDTRSADEKLRDAKEAGHLLRHSVNRSARPSGTQLSAAQEENLRSQPRSIVGSPDAIPHRERIAPVYVGSLSSTEKEISGGLPFSPWVK